MCRDKKGRVEDFVPPFLSTFFYYNKSVIILQKARGLTRCRDEKGFLAYGSGLNVLCSDGEALSPEKVQ